MAEIIGKVLFTEEQIRQRAKELGEQIARDYEGEEIYLIGTLKGGIVWMADIMKAIPNDTKIDFICASSYGSGTSTTGVVKIKKDVEADLFNKNVIIIEDIVDTGTTLKFIKSYLAERNPKSVKICTLLDKPSRRLCDVQADYIGFEIDNLFVVGYGLDYDQKYRNLPYVGYIEG
ncbi:MAG: hypoxanthine phosphoribosyltransferase [Clostridia bacterium]|nr:hypoxanthine phosphoribosyltransferase [Clostridia bacterium]